MGDQNYTHSKPKVPISKLLNKNKTIVRKCLLVMQNCNQPHWDNIFNLRAEGHAILSKPNSIFPFAHPIMTLQSFLQNPSKQNTQHNQTKNKNHSFTKQNITKRKYKSQSFMRKKHKLRPGWRRWEGSRCPWQGFPHWQGVKRPWKRIFPLFLLGPVWI